MSKLKLVEVVHNWNRRRKWELFTERCLVGTSQTILDVGFTVAATSVGYANALENSVDNLSRVTALTIDDIPNPEAFSEFNLVQYDGRDFPFEDGEFDLCWSNAVLEHVGSDIDMVEFLREIVRVGQRGFITTPNRWFPIEPHTKLPLLHFLPKPLFDSLLHKLGKSWATGSYMDLLGERRLRRLLAEAQIQQYELVKNKFGPFTMDFVVLYN